MRELRLAQVLLHVGLLAICSRYHATALAGENSDLGLKGENEVQIPPHSGFNVELTSAFEFGRSLVRGRRYIVSSFPQLHQGTRRHVSKAHKKTPTTGGRTMGKTHKKPIRKIKPYNFTTEKFLKKIRLSSDTPFQTQPAHTFLQFVIRPKTSARMRPVSLSVPDSLPTEGQGQEIEAEKGHINKTQGASSFFLPMDTDFFKGVLSGQRKTSNFNNTGNAGEMTIVNIEILEMPRNDKSPKQFFRTTDASSENTTQPALSTEPLDNDTKSTETTEAMAPTRTSTRSIKDANPNLTSTNFSEESKPRSTTHGRVHKAGIDIMRRITTIAFSDGKTPNATVFIDDLIRLIVDASSNKQEKQRDKERKQRLQKQMPARNNESSNEVMSTPTNKEENQTVTTTDDIDRGNTGLPRTTNDELVIGNNTNINCSSSTNPVLKTTETKRKSGDPTENGVITSEEEVMPSIILEKPSEFDPNEQEQVKNATEKVTGQRKTTLKTLPETSSTLSPPTDNGSLLSVISMISSYAVQAMIQPKKKEENMHENEMEGSDTLSGGQTLPIPTEDVATSETTTTSPNITTDRPKNAVRASKMKRLLDQNNFENITSPTPVIYLLTGVTEANRNSPQEQMARSTKGTIRRRKTMIFNSSIVTYQDKENQMLKATQKNGMGRNRTQMLYILSHLETPQLSTENCNSTLGDLCTTPSNSEQDQATNATGRERKRHLVPFTGSRNTTPSLVYVELSSDLQVTIQSTLAGGRKSSISMSENRPTMPAVEKHESFSSENRPTMPTVENHESFSSENRPTMPTVENHESFSSENRPTTPTVENQESFSSESRPTTPTVENQESFSSENRPTTPTVENHESFSSENRPTMPTVENHEYFSSENRPTTPTVENHESFVSTPSNISDVESSNGVESTDGNVSGVSNQTDLEKKLQTEAELRRLFEKVHTALETPSQNEQGFMQISDLHNLIHEFVMRILEFLKKTQDQGTLSPNATEKSRSPTPKPDINSTMYTVNERTKPTKSRGRRRTVKFLRYIRTSTSSTSCHSTTRGQT